MPKDQLDVSLTTRIIIIIGGLLLTSVFMYFISHPADTTTLLYIVAAFVLLYLIYKATVDGKPYVIAIAAVIKLSMIVMVFFALFEQTATSVLLFTERLVNLDLFGFTISSASVKSLNPLFIILIAPMFAALWSRWNPTVFAKMGSGLVLSGIAMATFLSQWVS